MLLCVGVARGHAGEQERGQQLPVSQVVWKKEWAAGMLSEGRPGLLACLTCLLRLRSVRTTAAHLLLLQAVQQLGLALQPFQLAGQAAECRQVLAC